MEANGKESVRKIIAGADPFGAPLKDHVVNYLKAKQIEVEDLGTDGKYYHIGEAVGRKVAEESNHETRGLVVCGTGVGVGIFANKVKGIYATTCTKVSEAVNGRSINNSNVLSLGAVVTQPEEAEKIVDAWLETEFKAPCPANEGKPWPEEVHSFLDNSVDEMSKIGVKTDEKCAICELASGRKFDPVDIMPGGSWKIVREDPTSAVVRFKAGSLEPAHHHTYGHDLIVIEGNKRVWNLTKNQAYELGPGDFLYTPAGDVHRVEYLSDTEFFIRWDGHWDIFLDEDLDTAAAAVKKDN